MSPQETSIQLIKKVYRNSFQFLKENLEFLSPFLILAILEFIALIFLYLAPRVPLRIVLGPPIKTFWGERFLHYPINFILLPKLIAHARMVLSIVFGSLLSGMAVAIIFDVYNKKRVKLFSAFKVAIRKYLPLFGIILIINIGFFLIRKVITITLLKYFYSGHPKLLFMGPKIWLGLIFTCLVFILAAIVQSIFVYSIPAIIIDNKRFFKAIGRSFGIFIRFFIPTFLFVFIPMLIFIPIIALSSNNTFLIEKLFPEVIFFVEALGIILSTLVIDPFITVCATILYLMKREP